MSFPPSKSSTVASTGASTPASMPLRSGTSGKSAATTTSSTTLPTHTPHGSTTPTTPKTTAPSSETATTKPYSTVETPKQTHTPTTGHKPPTSAATTPKPHATAETPKPGHKPATSAPAPLVLPRRNSSSQNNRGPKKEGDKKRIPCPPHLCTLVPTDVPAPEFTQAILHPRKDVFVLKVAKVGPRGDRRCRMELELVTPKAQDQTPPYRTDTRETQCDPECTCCCSKAGRKKNDK